MLYNSVTLLFQMPRLYIRNTNKGLVTEERMREAVNAVKNGMKVRKAAREYGIARSTLNNNLTKDREGNGLPTRLVPNYRHSLVFTAKQEADFASYLKDCARMFHGLTTKNVRILAYEMAKVNNIAHPLTWDEQMMAGNDWLCGFLRRNPELTIRQPEATSLARATAFNKHNICTFFNIVKETITKLNVSGAQIYNLDESGLTTVQKVPKVIAPRGVKQIGQVTSRERGELVTICCIVSAAGHIIPPVFVFPRKNFKNFMLAGAPEGSLGLVNESGWMTRDNFVKVINHFIKHSRPSKDFPLILILDNHDSHISFESLELCKKNNIHVITLPPHTSSKTQPLDRSVFGPMKSVYNNACDSWMMKNVGTPLTIYQVANLGGHAFLKAATPINIQSGFAVSGIWPFNEDVFTEDDFMPSEITNRPISKDSENATLESNEQTGSASPHCGTSTDQTAQEFHENQKECNVENLVDDLQEISGSLQHKATSSFTSPHVFRGLPKAGPRKDSNNMRKRGKTMLATSTPEMDRIRERAVMREKAAKVPPKKAKRQLLKELDVDSDPETDISFCDDTDSDVSFGENEECTVSLTGVREVFEGQCVLCEYGTKKTCVYYVGIVRGDIDDDGDVEVEFLRKSEKVAGKFVKPKVEDVVSVSITCIKAQLTRSTITGTTSRTKDGYVFKESLAGINVR